MGSSDPKERSSEAVETVKRFEISKIPLETMDSFIIPFGPKSKYTFLSLSLSLRLPSSEASREIETKIHYIRGLIYEALSYELGHNAEVPKMERVKTLVLDVANENLESGKVRSVYITHFLPV